MEFNDDDEYVDHHPYNARPQTRSERRKSNQPLEKVAAQHPTARNTLSSQQTRNKVNDCTYPILQFAKHDDYRMPPVH
jgi:hypothetical protein